MATIIVDGFPSREKTLHAEKLAVLTNWQYTRLEWVHEKIPFWEYGSQVWDYSPDCTNKVIDGFICESWHDSDEPINHNQNIRSIAKVQNVLYRRDDLLYLWVATPDQIRTRAGIIERLNKTSGIALSVLGEDGSIQAWCPPGTWNHKIKNMRSWAPQEWYKWYE